MSSYFVDVTAWLLVSRTLTPRKYRRLADLHEDMGAYALGYHTSFPDYQMLSREEKIQNANLGKHIIMHALVTKGKRVSLGVGMWTKRKLLDGDDGGKVCFACLVVITPQVRKRKLSLEIFSLQ